MKPEISVIVPVYNVEPYLRRCLDSIVGQTMKEIEIILIDDGSTDNSGKICDEYSEKDSRIRVIHQKNGGLSNARNTGIANVKGKYIMFVDSDDYVEKDFCQTPFEIAENNGADLVMFCHRTVRNEKIIKTGVFHFEEGFKTKQEAFDLTLKSIGVHVSNFLAKKQLFEEIRYPDGYVYEDAGTTYKIILAANTIYFINRVLFNYMIRNNSITTSGTKKEHVIVQYYEMYHQLTELNYDCFIQTIAAMRSLRYLIYFGFNNDLSPKCQTLIDAFDNYKVLNKRSLILLFTYKFSKPLFNFICILTGKRNKPERF